MVLLVCKIVYLVICLFCYFKKGDITLFTNYTDEIMNEILGGAYGPSNKADETIDSMNRVTGYITDFIQIFKDLFASISALFNM